ncbi:MAG: cupin domain-containing protein [Chlorobiales bacterium]|jgi:cupin 2 domain-containing protein|nr:cupin domain-containing protein [Chlorobiales bacterium]
MQTGNIYSRIPDQLQGEFFDTLVQNQTLRLERIISTGQATPEGEWYDQAWDEWVVLLTGSATLRFESEEPLFEMTPGNYVFIPARCRHRVEQTDTKEKTVWLALHIQPEIKG